MRGPQGLRSAFLLALSGRCGKPVGIPLKREPMVATGSLKIHTAIVAQHQGHNRARDAIGNGMASRIMTMVPADSKVASSETV